ncbi:MAG: DHA2 family efflux MFS transporter permease subunit [Eggerthellaceae bacterium]
MLDENDRVLDAKLVLSIIACGIMSFAGVVVETAMNVAFPALMQEFSVDTATVQWVTTAYLLVLTCIVPISAFLKRRFRMKSLFATAICLFIAGTVICAAAPAFSFIVAGRVVQAVGTGMALPLMFNIIIEQAPLDRIGFMMGLGTLVTAMAPAVGPSFGGFVIGLWGWRMIFVVLLPFLVAAFFVGILSIRQSSETSRARFDVAQFLFLSLSFVCLVLALSSASTAGWMSVQVIGLLVAFIGLLVLFCIRSSRSSQPLIHVGIFRSRSFALSTLYVVLLQMVVLGLGYLIPYYGQVVLRLSEFDAGCLLVPGCILGAVLSPIGGRILDRMGSRRPLVLGAIVQLAGMLCFWLLGFGEYAWVIALVYVLIPLSQGLSMANSITNGLSYLPSGLKSDGNAAFQTLQQLGGALGTAMATSIMNTAQAAEQSLVAGTIAGTQSAVAALLVLSAIALVCMLGVFAGQQRSPEDGARR